MRQDLLDQRAAGLALEGIGITMSVISIGADALTKVADYLANKPLSFGSEADMLALAGTLVGGVFGAFGFGMAKAAKEGLRDLLTPTATLAPRRPTSRTSGPRYL